jgi:hypothetical protein
VVVPSGAHCTLEPGTRVAQDVTVQSGGSLTAQGVSIGHDLLAAGGVAICNTTIEHDLHVMNNRSGQVAIGGDCGSDSIGHDLQVMNNDVPVTVLGNRIGHDMHVENNAGGSTVSGNSVGHDASCHGDSPAATGSANTAGHTNNCPGAG